MAHSTASTGVAPNLIAALARQCAAADREHSLVDADHLEALIDQPVLSLGDHQDGADRSETRGLSRTGETLRPILRWFGPPLPPQIVSSPVAFGSAECQSAGHVCYRFNPRRGGA